MLHVLKKQIGSEFSLPQMTIQNSKINLQGVEEGEANTL